jgi:hypothetical protein
MISPLERPGKGALGSLIGRGACGALPSRALGRAGKRCGRAVEEAHGSLLTGATIVPATSFSLDPDLIIGHHSRRRLSRVRRAPIVRAVIPPGIGPSGGKSAGAAIRCDLLDALADAEF